MSAAGEPANHANGRRALITGISGQDGSFLAELLLEKGYVVCGMVRGDSLGSSEHLRGDLELVRGDLFDRASVRAAIERAAPAELYHLAGPSFVRESWRAPGDTIAAIAGATAEVLCAARDRDRATRVYVASSGLIFGDTDESPQRETTECHPTTPYAVAKLASHQLAGLMRRTWGTYSCSGITFNHESERRPERFVTRKITRAAAAASLGLTDELRLGDLDAVRDWSFAGDVVRGAWMMLQQDEPADYVLASGVGRTVRDFADAAFGFVDLDAERYIRIDEQLLDAPEPTPSIGDPTKARERLGWQAQVGFEELVRRMVEADLRELRVRAGP